MRLAVIGAFAFAVVAGFAAPAGAASVEFRHIAAQVTIVPQDRSDVQVVILKTNPRIPLRVYRAGDRTVVAGANWMSWFWSPGPDCVRVNDELVPHLIGGGVVAEGDLPQIVVFTPMDAEVAATGAFYGVVGHADSLKLASAGCGRWTIANIKNGLSLDSAGWNEVRGGHAGTMKVRIGGGANIREQGVSDGLEVSIAGSGSVKVAEASGPIRVSIGGGGDIEIDGGHATTLGAHIAGSGDIKYRGVADSLDAGIAGSGQIDVAKVTGDVKKHIAGSGAIDVGR